MKTVCVSILTFILSLLPIYIFSQREIAGTYSYKFIEGTYSYFETITLYSEGSFVYNLISSMGLKNKIQGNWQQRENKLILDSYPQRDKIIIREHYKKKTKGTVLNVEDKNGNKFFYHLYVVLQNGDTLLLRDQIGQTSINKKIKSFWIEDTKGLRSRKNMLLSEMTNYVDVIFEIKRIFEDEDWLIMPDNKLQPRGLDGNFQDYYLDREK